MKKHLHHLIIIFPAVLIVGLIVFAILRFNGFINKVTIDTEISQEDLESYEDNYDIIVPLLDKDGYLVKQDVRNVLVFGNGPFAEDRDSENGMASLLSEALGGANVINCAISGTYATPLDNDNPLDNPMDVYTPFYLTSLMAFPGYVEDNIDAAPALLGDENPPDAAEVIETLKNLDPETIDIVVFFYDLTDYYLERPCFFDLESISAETFGGNVYYAVNMINSMYPHIRVICMSPYYNSFTDKDGNPVSAELKKNKWGTPGNYVLAEGGGIQVFTPSSFIDNYFGSIDENNYKKYLSDERHLNQDGRKLLVERLSDVILMYAK